MTPAPYFTVVDLADMRDRLTALSFSADDFTLPTFTPPDVRDISLDEHEAAYVAELAAGALVAAISLATAVALVGLARLRSSIRNRGR